MMENPGAHNPIEAPLQFVYTLNGQLVDLEVVQAVFSLEILSTPHARPANVDADNLRRRPTQCMLGCLRCAAAGNENGEVFHIGSGRPK